MFRRKFVKAAGATMVGGLLAGCSGNSGGGTDTAEPTDTSEPTDTAEPTDTPEPTDTSEPTGTAEGTGTPVQDVETNIGNLPDGIEVQNTQLYVQGDSQARVTGTIENTTDQQFDELEVQATLIDDQSDILGRWFDDSEESEAGSLAAGATWDFAVEFESPDLDTVARVRIDVDGDIDDSVWNGTPSA